MDKTDAAVLMAFFLFRRLLFWGYSAGKAQAVRRQWKKSGMVSEYGLIKRCMIKAQRRNMEFLQNHIAR